MANVKFSGLPAAGSLAIADIFAVTQGGVSKQASLGQLPANVSLQTAVIASPTGTTSTTGNGVMMGLGTSGSANAVITPVSSGKIWVAVTGNCLSDTAADGVQLVMVYGTGTAPTNGTASPGGGTLIGSTVQRQGAGWGASQRSPFTLSAVITGLTLGVQIWIDLAQVAVTGGTASAANVSVAAFEL